MLRYKLLYAAILAGLVCFYVLYIDYLPLVLLICALLMPLFLKAGLIWLHFTSDAHLESPTEVCSAGGSIPVTVVIENRSPFAFPKGTVQLRVTHGFEAGRETVKIHFPLQAKNSTRLSLQISADYCGIVNVEIVSLRMYDMLRLFHTNIRKSKKVCRFCSCRNLWDCRWRHLHRPLKIRKVTAMPTSRVMTPRSCSAYGNISRATL
jgi:hypothetical protein